MQGILKATILTLFYVLRKKAEFVVNELGIAIRLNKVEVSSVDILYK